MVGNLGYQSGWTDPETAKVNMAARWYSPQTGQFSSRDTVSNSPLPVSVNANRYAFGNQNPMTEVDPTGHWSIGGLVKKAMKAVKKVTKKAKAAVKSTWKKSKTTVKKAAKTVRKAAKAVKRTVKKAVRKAHRTVRKAVRYVQDSVKKVTMSDSRSNDNPASWRWRRSSTPYRSRAERAGSRSWAGWVMVGAPLPCGRAGDSVPYLLRGRRHPIHASRCR